MKKHYETHVEDTDKLISVAGPVLDYKSWYEQYRKLMEEQAQRKYGLYTPTSEGDDDDFPSIPGMIARYSALGLTNEQMKQNPVWVDKTGNGHDLQMKNFAWKEGSGISDVYPGALVFDGVDDYGVCDNFPILTKEKGYTVSFGATRGQKDLPHILTYQTSKSYNGNLIATGSYKGTDVLHVGRLVSTNVGARSNVAIWELVFLDHDATEEELTKIKDYFVKTYPWLFFDQAWTVTGKTNEDEDRATIANITGNGNDLVLSNFGFAEGSGYGLYKTPFELYPSVQHSSKYSLSFSKFALGDHNLIIAPKQNDLSYDIKVKVTGLKDGVKFKWGWIGTTGYIDITTDGIHMLNKPASQIRQLIVEFAEDFDPDHVVTIEQIPEYEGYLITDGVDDEVRSAAFTLNEDWTIVGNWEFITNENKNAGLTKVYSFYLYNRDYGIFVYEYLNAGQGFSVEDVKSLKAICSDGRIYLNDWQEIRNNIEQEVTISKGVMAIGYFNRDFTKMAFKNLGIYNNQLLSKDDCIKAYNYLQTLKAK